MKPENFLYEKDYLLAGFVTGRKNSNERYIVGGKTRDLASFVTEQLEVRTLLADDIETRESLPIKSVLYIKQDDYKRLGIEQTGILRDELSLPPGPFSMNEENVRNPDWDKISEVRHKGISVSFEFFLLMERPLKLHYKKEITRDGISLTYDVIDRAKGRENE